MIIERAQLKQRRVAAEALPAATKSLGSGLSGGGGRESAPAVHGPCCRCGDTGAGKVAMEGHSFARLLLFHAAP